MDNVTIEEFKKLDIRIGKILSAENIEGSEKLLKLQVDFGEFQRQILSGIAKWYNASDLVDKLCPFIINLEARKMMGLESQGMLVAVGGEEAVLLFPDKEVQIGSKLT